VVFLSGNKPCRYFFILFFYIYIVAGHTAIKREGWISHLHTFNPWYFRIMKIQSKLNSDGQLFQYQQNELSPLTLTHWIQKWNNEIWCWKSISLLGTATKMWWVLNRLVGYPSFPLDSCMSSDNVYIKKQYKKIPTRFC
jgi:hypothetical protein